ncbi:MAG: hydrogenase maturation protease [Acidobacteria bacterium]|nr:MAG: hydrogenase maturation protease [Acidobacteriota bacterium]
MRGDVLVIGWGNPGRGDDGLGPACVEALARRAPVGVRFEQDYQLQPEHAADVAQARLVVFVDAACDAPAAVYVEPVAPRPASGFTTHGLAPAALLEIARGAFGAQPAAWIVGIRGSCFEPFREELSPEARDNLGRAVGFLDAVLAADDPAEELERAARCGVPTASAAAGGEGR